MSTNEIFGLSLPSDPSNVAEVQRYLNALLAIDLRPSTVPAWLGAWSNLEASIMEAAHQSLRAWTVNTSNMESKSKYQHFVHEIQPQLDAAAQLLRLKFLDVQKFVPDKNTQVLARRFQCAAELYREENMPLIAELSQLLAEYDKIVDTLSVSREGSQFTIAELELQLLNPNRRRREDAWHTIQNRWLTERAILDELFLQMLSLRRRIARNAGHPNYRSWLWHHYGRFDYMPQHCIELCNAIEAEIVPLSAQLFQDRADALGVATVRPWDLEIDTTGLTDQVPTYTLEDSEAAASRILMGLDRDLGRRFDLLRISALDFKAQPSKAPGTHRIVLPNSGYLSIIMSATTSPHILRTIMNATGHALQFSSARANDLIWNRFVPREFGNALAMALELLTAPYYTVSEGGILTQREGRRVRIEQLEQIIRFFRYMAVIDTFERWVYADAPDKLTAQDIDRTWSDLWQRFTPNIDWNGLESQREMIWHRNRHIYALPLYYAEYGLSQLGALQIWRNALKDQNNAVASYRRALALNYTRSLPELFSAANTRLAFDRMTIKSLTTLIRETLDGLR